MHAAQVHDRQLLREGTAKTQRHKEARGRGGASPALQAFDRLKEGAANGAPTAYRQTGKLSARRISDLQHTDGDFDLNDCEG